ITNVGDSKVDQMKEMFDKVELSASPYDTAWVAMVPSLVSPAPCFPDSVTWLLENQLKDGSWGLPSQVRHPLHMKDTLSSTLACLLALRRWGIGDQHIHNALGFMERNSAYLNDSTQETSIGFDITFPAMIQTSIKDFNLNLPLKSANIDAMIRNRESILRSSAANSEGRNAYLAYISEGIGELQDWEAAMKFQRKNGSLFNSPSATAAACIHLQDPEAFRYLRSISTTGADVFDRFTEDRFWNDTMEGYLKDERALVELHKASKVHDVLNYPFEADLERLTHKRNIEQYCVDDETRILKSSFRSSIFGNQALLKLAIEDFNFCQTFHQKELAHLMRWLKEYKLEELRLGKGKMGYCCLTAAAIIFAPEHFHARISCVKHGVIAALIDEIYDMNGTPEEQLNLIHLLERWDVVGPKVDFASERVETLYWALHNAICETAENAFALQGRNVTDHVVKIWLDYLRSQLRESERSKNGTPPTLDEYMSNGSVTVGLGPIILPTLYLLGPKLPDEVARGPEVGNLFNTMSVCGRLLNDRISIDRDVEEGNWNLVVMSQGCKSREEIDEEIKGVIENKTKELLRLVCDEKKTDIVPKECRELFWKMNTALHLAYKKDDGFGTLQFDVFQSLIDKPI
ncbi:Ent-kaurene synthase 5, chloroplastic, partial [Linum grandiflorum]